MMNDHHEPLDIATSVSNYQQLRPTYEAFTDKAYNLILELLKTADVSPQSIEHRTKTVKSFSEKIQREGKSYKNPLEELTDLCGVRIILHTIEDVDRVCDLIEEEFDIDHENSVDKRTALKPHEFGYLSVHYIVRLNKERASLREYKNHLNRRLEIQVRTVLQHAWAAIDHRLRYKSNTDAPEHLRRRLFLLSGLLELADREFSELVIKAERYSDHVRERISENDLLIPVDVQSLTRYISDSEAVARIIQASRRAGMPEYPDEDPFFEEEIISDLAFFCNIAQLTTIKELDELLASFEAKAEEFYSAVVMSVPDITMSPAMIIIYAVWARGIRMPEIKDLIERHWPKEFATKILAIVKQHRI